MTAELAAVRRLDGRLYRPRKLRAFLLDGDGEANDSVRVLVLGTHDVIRATGLARVLCRAWDRGYEPHDPTQGWWRSGIRDHTEWFEPDERRGRAGVMFEVGEVLE